MPDITRERYLQSDSAASLDCGSCGEPARWARPAAAITGDDDYSDERSIDIETPTAPVRALASDELPYLLCDRCRLDLDPRLLSAYKPVEQPKRLQLRDLYRNDFDSPDL